MFVITNISIILFFTFLVNAVVLMISWQRRNSAVGLYFALGMTGVALWSLGEALDYSVTALGAKIFLSKIEAIGYLSAMALFTITTLYFAGNERWLERKWVKVLFILLPLVNILLVLTNDLHQLVWTAYEPHADNIFVFVHGPAFTWMMLTTYSQVLLMFVNFWMAFRKGTSFVRRQAILLTFALLIPVITNTIYHLQIGAEGVDWSSVTFSLSGIIFLYALYGGRFLDIIQVARDAILEQMNDGVVVFDDQNRLADFNRAAQAIFGVSRQDLWLPLPQTALAKFPEVIALLTGDTEETMREIASGGKLFDTHLTLLKDQRGKRQGRLLVMRDITARKQVEQSLQASEAQTRAIVNSVPDLLFRFNRQGVFLDFHSRDTSMFYVPPEMFLNQTLASILPADIAGQAMQAIEQALASNQMTMFEYALEIGGEVNYYEDRITPLGADEVLSIIRDITARKQAEEKLRKSEEQYRFLLDNTSDFIARYDRNGVMIFGTEAARHFHGYEAEEIINTSVFERIHPEDHEEVRKILQRAIETGNEERMEYRIERKSGEYMWVEAIGQRVFNSLGEPEVIVVQRDITERRQVEQALRESEAHFREVFDNTAHGTFIIDVEEDGRFRIGNSNKAEEILTTVPREAVMGKLLGDAFPADIAQMLEANYSRAIAAGTAIAYEEDVDLSGTGLKSYFTTLAPVKDKTGRFYRIIGSTLEITERRQMEKELRASEERFRQLVISAPDAVFGVDEAGMITFANEEATRLLGYVREEFNGMEVDQLLPVNTRDLHESYRVEYMSNPRTRFMGAGLHLQARHKAGNEIPVDIKLSHIKNGAGIQVIVFMRDITQRVQQEAALREAHAQLLEQQRVLAKMEERQQLARDLHDSVNQSIHSLMLFSETLVVLLRKDKVHEALAVAERIQYSGQQALKEIRLLLYKAQSIEVDQGTSLIGVLEERLSMVERRVGIKVELIRADELEERCPSAWIENLYWIIMEALNNSLKYAQAKHLTIRFDCADNRFEVEVADDGVGFDPKRTRLGGFGMKSMRERAKLLGGKVTIDSSPGAGTRVYFAAEMESQA